MKLWIERMPLEEAETALGAAADSPFYKFYEVRLAYEAMKDERRKGRDAIMQYRLNESPSKWLVSVAFNTLTRLKTVTAEECFEQILLNEQMDRRSGEENQIRACLACSVDITTYKV